MSVRFPYKDTARRAQESLSDLDDDGEGELLLASNDAASTGHVPPNPQYHHSAFEHTTTPLVRTQAQLEKLVSNADGAIREIVLGESAHLPLWDHSR